MSEIIWYETKMTSNTAPAPLVASASSSDSSGNYEAWKAFDGLVTGQINVWGGSTVVSWIMIDFGEKKRIDKVRFTPRRASNINQTPKDFYTEGSLDGTSWVTIGEFSNVTDWVKFTAKEYNLIGGDFRYLKINHTATNGATIASWQQIQFGGIKKERRLVLKNPTTNQHYSLVDKTLITLPDTSSKNMILHGIEAGVEIKLDEALDKIQYNFEIDENNKIGDFFVSLKNTIEKPLSIKLMKGVG